MAKQTINIGTTANDGTGDQLRSAFDKVNDNFTELYSDDAGDVGSITATAPIARDQATGAVTISLNDAGISTAKLANNAVTHDKLENRYTAKATSTGTGSQNLDASAATTFLLTGNVATATLTIQNMKLGQVIDIVLSGTLTSAVITLATNFTSATINKVGSTNLDTSATNLIQVVCVDDTDSAAIVNYSINTFVADTTP